MRSEITLFGGADGPAPEKRWYTVPEFAAELRLSIACVRAWTRKRRIAVLRAGRPVRIPVEEAERIVQEGFRPAVNKKDGGR